MRVRYLDSSDLADRVIGKVVLQPTALVPCPVSKLLLDFARNLGGFPTALSMDLRVSSDPSVALLDGKFRFASSSYDAVWRMSFGERLYEFQTNRLFLRGRCDLKIK